MDALDLNKSYSYADYLGWKFEGLIELIKGKIVPMSAPHWQHQRIVGNLHGIIWQHLKKKPCQIFPAPFDVRLVDRRRQPTEDSDIFTVVQPDLTIICRPEIISKTGCLGAPDAVIEVVSPSTADRDVKLKFDIYQESLIPEYWIVFPKDQIVFVYDLVEEKYQLRKTYSIDDKVQMKVLGDCWVDLADIFDRVDD